MEKARTKEKHLFLSALPEALARVSLCVCGKSLQLCSTLCDPMDCSPLSSSVHEILQARNTGVGSQALLQGILLTQGSNLHL